LDHRQYLYKEYEEIKQFIYLVYKGELELKKKIKVDNFKNGSLLIKNKTIVNLGKLNIITNII